MQIHPCDVRHMTWPTKPVPPPQPNTVLVFISEVLRPLLPAGRLPPGLQPSPPSLPCVIRIKSPA